MEDIILPPRAEGEPPRRKEEVICHLFEDGKHTKTGHEDWEGLPSPNPSGKNALICMVETWRGRDYLNAFGLREFLETALYEDSIFGCGPKIFYDHVFVAKWWSRGSVEARYLWRDENAQSQPGYGDYIVGGVVRRASPYRPYYRLEPDTKTGSVFGTTKFEVAARPSIIFWYSTHNGAFNGHIFFDPERVYVLESRVHEYMSLRRVLQKGDTPETACAVRPAQCISNEIEKLSYHGDAVEFANRIKLLIFQYVMDETLLVLSPLLHALSHIQSHLSDDELVQRGLQSSRKFLNEWTQQCFEMSASLTYMRDKVDLSNAPGALVTKDRHLQSLLKSTIPRIEGLQQALMSSMSIIDSKEAIREAKNVGKLTQLAFFFIPLTFVAGTFGMNIVSVLEHGLLCFAGG
ncbi:hypothetical protein DL765_003468 [Monosporascus sp. GIB2]|nr:hypothetical protein DL765_003468 [Monosporascus sp. GIB2]